MEVKLCDYCGSSKRVTRWSDGKLVCGKHWHQMSRHGRILVRTIRDDSVVTCGVDGVCTLVVFNRLGVEVARSIFNEIHVVAVRGLKWSMSSSGYPRNIKTRKYLHQIVKPARIGYEIDHVDGNKLNNLDSNLRYATRTENSRNLSLSKRNRSGCRGVWFDKVTNSWQVKICVDRKQLFLGRFPVLEKAIEVRKQAEVQYYGEFTRK